MVINVELRSRRIDLVGMAQLNAHNHQKQQQQKISFHIKYFVALNKQFCNFMLNKQTIK